jgi:zinc protease
MQVILHPDHSAPLAHLNLRFAVGSKHEAPGRVGFAHLFEHLMGENADAVGGYIMVAGATGINAGTHADYTDYYETVPASRLERMLWLESNQWRSLPQRLTQERFAREREIVINERRERVDDQPYAIANSLFHRFVFPPGHPYSHDVIGTPADLMASSLDDDSAQTKSWIAKYFGSFAPGPGLISPPSSSAPMTAQIERMRSAMIEEVERFAREGPSSDEIERAAI